MTKVVVANRLVRGGKEYKGGDVIDVKPGEARLLKLDGKVRPHDETAEPAAAKPETKGAKNG